MGLLGEEMPSYDEKRLELKNLIMGHGIVFKDVELFSGVKSPYYYDIKNVSLRPDGLHLLSELLLTEIIKYGAKSVGGMEMGAVALVSAMMVKSTMGGKYDTSMKGFFIRKEHKGYGLQKRIEGNLVTPAVIIDDVITSGQSTMNSIKAVNEEGVTPGGVICVIDREEGTPNLLKQANIRYSSLFTHSEFKPFIERRLRENR